MYVCELGGAEAVASFPDKCGLLVGPEGGWSQAEKTLFGDNNFTLIHISDFVLRAETAVVVAAALALMPSKTNAVSAE
jgi:RsmE family RNA methyltransferase